MLSLKWKYTDSEGGADVPNKWLIPFLILSCASFLLVNQMDLPYMLKQGLVVLYVIAYFGAMVVSRKMKVRDHKQ